MSIVLKTILENIGFVKGNDLIMPEPDEVKEMCSKLHEIERTMHEILTFNLRDEAAEEARILERRCRTVMNPVRHAREGLVSLCASIAHSGYLHEFDLIHSRFGSFSGSPLPAPSAFSMQPEAPLHLNEDLLSEAKAVFDSFADSVGNKTNGKSNRWEMKAHAVKDVENYARDKLAVKARSFFFYNKETKKLTDCPIWWRKDGAMSFEILPWTRLLQDTGTGYAENLNVIPSKTHQQFLDLLKRLVKRNLY